MVFKVFQNMNIMATKWIKIKISDPNYVICPDDLSGLLKTNSQYEANIATLVTHIK